MRLDLLKPIHCDHLLSGAVQRLMDVQTWRAGAVMKLSHNGHKLVS
jgi:hypothetical protein